MWTRRLIINNCFVRDVRTTQRVESINSIVADITTRQASLCSLGEQLRHYDDAQIIKSNALDTTNEVLTIGHMSSFLSMEKQMKVILTRFAYKKMGYELNESAAYRACCNEDNPNVYHVWLRNPTTYVESIADEDKPTHTTPLDLYDDRDSPENPLFKWKKWPVTNRRVELTRNEEGTLISISCSCGFPQYMGLFCRHVCAMNHEANDMLVDDKILRSLLHPIWARQSRRSDAVAVGINHDILKRSTGGDYSNSPVMRTDELVRTRGLKRQADELFGSIIDRALQEDKPHELQEFVSILKSVCGSRSNIEAHNLLAKNLRMVNDRDLVEWSTGGNTITPMLVTNPEDIGSFKKRGGRGTTRKKTQK